LIRGCAGFIICLVIAANLYEAVMMGKTDINGFQEKYVQIFPAITAVSFINIDINIQQENLSIFFRISIINVFTVTFDQFNASLLNKSIIFFPK